MSSPPITERAAEKQPEPSPGLYRHFKGNLYRVLHVASHSETEERLVIYHPLERPKSVWARPLAMFRESVEHEGKSQPRFVSVEEQEEEQEEEARNPNKPERRG